MTIKNWLKFSFNATAIGAILTALLSVFIRWDDFYQIHMNENGWNEAIGAFCWFLLLGVLISVVAQAGYFAYLTVHQIGVNMFRSLTLWNWIQLLLMIITIGDIIFFRFQPYAMNLNDWILYMILLISLIGAAVIAAFFKVRLTNKKHIFISALFFMIVITSVEWLIAMWVRVEGGDQYMILFLYPLIFVNAYQLLALPKYNLRSEKDLLKKEKRRKERCEIVQEE